MKYLLLTISILVCTSIIGQTTLIPTGATWQYYDAGNEPASQSGTEWYESGYNDGSWASGVAQLGYGDGDEKTQTLNAQTLYVRHTVNVSNPSQYEDLEIALTKDDGAIVYINGNEVYRTNMPAGAVNYNTFSSDQSSDNERTIYLVANSLVSGNNVIAVEIHQRSAGSSDLTFDMALTGLPPALIPRGDSWKYLDDGSDQGTAWIAPGFNDASWSTGNAVFGFGDIGAASINTTVSTGDITYYFRKEVNIPSASNISALSIRMLAEDGAIVYINGTEVVRENMPATNVDFQTTTATTKNDAFEESFSVFDICNDGLLVDGNNTVAVEVHQAAASSSDLGFEMNLLENTASSIDVVRGPYIQKLTPTSACVRWRTDFPTNATINYGTSPGNLDQTMTGVNCGIDHEFELTGLNNSTTYYYEVEHDGAVPSGQTDQHFITAPPAGTDQKVRAWILGDCGTANSDQRNVRDAYLNYVNNLLAGEDQTDMLLFLGDNAYDDGTDAEYQFALFENMYEDLLKNTVSWSCLGNHDGISALSLSQTGPYYDIFTFPTNGEAGGVASGTEAYYSFDFANVHFIVLESHQTIRTVGSPMYNWCLNDIQNTTQDWIVAFWHHPPYSKGSHDSDAETALIDMRANFLPILEENGVDLVLSGHSHAYERSYFINGHYGHSTTFDQFAHVVGTNGIGNGQLDGSGAYEKYMPDDTTQEGTVYVVTGSAGKKSGGTFDHPVMFKSESVLGSSVMEVNGDTLTLKFIQDDGVIDDYFTIVKETQQANSIVELPEIPAKVYPNPSDEEIIIELGEKEIVEMQLLDINGKLVHNSTLREAKNKIDVSKLPAGNYTIMLTTNEQQSSRQIIVE